MSKGDDAEHDDFTNRPVKEFLTAEAVTSYCRQDTCDHIGGDENSQPKNQRCYVSECETKSGANYPADCHQRSLNA